MDKHVVLVSRSWDNPNIAISVTDIDINISMALNDFITALAGEMGNPTLMVTRGQLLAKLQASATAVVDGMKKETARIM